MTAVGEAEGYVPEGYAEYVADLTAAMPRPGEQLLNELQDSLATYVVLPSLEAYTAVTLWIAATHVQPAWNAATRLVIKSPEKRCGKSRLLDIIEHTCHRPFPTFNATVAAVIRSIDETDPPTLLQDEADTIWSKSKSSSEGAEDLRALYNAGFQKGKPMWRCVGPSQTPTAFSPYAMAALAGIGDTIPDTILDRSVVIKMRRRAGGEHVEKFRIRRDVPPLNDLRDRLNNWIQPHSDELACAEPDLPVDDRAADAWESLVAVADLAGGGWPALARQACTVLADQAAEDDTDASLRLRLLMDLREVFGDTDALHGQTLCELLAELEDAPWADWYGRTFGVRDLSNMLKHYGIKGKQLFRDGHNRTGYRRDDLFDAWRRYAPAVPGSETTTDATTQRASGAL